MARGANKPYEVSSDLCLMLSECVKCCRSCVVQYFPYSPRFVTHLITHIIVGYHATEMLSSSIPGRLTASRYINNA